MKVFLHMDERVERLMNKNLINNESGHGYPSLGKILLVILTFPVSVPVILIKEKLKERKEK